MPAEHRIAIHLCTRCGQQVEVWEIGRILIDPATFVCGDHLQPLGAEAPQPSQFQAPTLREERAA